MASSRHCLAWRGGRGVGCATVAGVVLLCCSLVMVSSHNGRWRGAALGERREIALSRLGSASSGSSGAKYKYFSPTFETSLSDSDCNKTVCYSITKGGISSHLHITPTNNKLRYVPIIIRNFFRKIISI